MNSGREGVERRLAAVLAADVAAYSRLMGEDEDEEGTHAALTALRREESDPRSASIAAASSKPQATAAGRIRERRRCSALRGRIAARGGVAQ
jgi:adenylate cyclase